MIQCLRDMSFVYTVSVVLQFAYLALRRDSLEEKCLFDWKQKNVALHIQLQRENETFCERWFHMGSLG